MNQEQDERRQYKLGFISVALTYVLWGLFPLYWALLSHVEAYSILAQRIVWSFVFMLVVVICKNPKYFIADCKLLWSDKKGVILMLGASILITMNWLIYIWAVNNGHVMDASVGYYLNPLVSVLLGVIFFDEYLITAKKISVGLATIGIIILTVELGTFPWISIGLALTFGCYGAVKKKLRINPFCSITLETLLALPLALVYLNVLNPSSWQYFTDSDPSTMIYFIGSGVVTAVPLLFFSYGANILPLNVIGFLQYTSPTIVLFLAIFFFHETFSMPQFIAFACIWTALVIFTVSERIVVYRKNRKQR